MTPSEQQHATTQALLESRREARIIPRQNYVKGQDSALEGDHWKRMTANDKVVAGAKTKPSIMDEVRYHDPVNKRGRIEPGHVAMSRDEYNKYSSQWKHPWFKDKDLGGTRKVAAGRDVHPDADWSVGAKVGNVARDPNPMTRFGVGYQQLPEQTIFGY